MKNYHSRLKMKILSYEEKFQDIIDEYFIIDKNSWINIDDIYNIYRECYGGSNSCEGNRVAHCVTLQSKKSRQKFVDLLTNEGYEIKKSIIYISKYGHPLKHPKEHIIINGLRPNDEFNEVYGK